MFRDVRGKTGRGAAIDKLWHFILRWNVEDAILKSGGITQRLPSLEPALGLPGEQERSG